MSKFLLLLTLTILSACAKISNTELGKNAIALVMQYQQEAWNKGDLIGFMNGYWESDSLVFVGRSGLTYGWKKTLDNYKKGYPNRQAMGQLKFNNVLYRPLKPNHFWVAGQWQLYRDTDTLSGHYTLVWRKMNGHWFIISDHSS